MTSAVQAFFSFDAAEAADEHKEAVAIAGELFDAAEAADRCSQPPSSDSNSAMPRERLIGSEFWDW